jgi:predicted enzyme related to lactoylglutathione lyase
VTHGTWIWSELATDDVEAAKAFYAATLGWSYEASDMPGGQTYWIATLGEQRVAGLFDKRPMGLAAMPAHWMGYVMVDDVDARVAQAEGLGARLHRAPFEVAGVGRIAILADPTGALLAWMTPRPAA